MDSEALSGAAQHTEGAFFIWARSPREEDLPPAPESQIPGQNLGY